MFRDARAILLRNERDEWELPGGKLDADESPTDCCAREIHEELALDVSVDRPEGYRASVRSWWKLRHTG